MKPVFCIGETVLDIIFQHQQPIAAKPGGSMLNAAVSLGRAGLKPVYISDFGEDPAGDLIRDFLLYNHVDIRFTERFRDGKTAISLAFLDEQRDASYLFYRQFPGERLTSPLPLPPAGSILLFGSSFAMNQEVRRSLWHFLTNAKNNNATLLYDPNFREPRVKQLPEFRPWILENISLSAITRGSAEDFGHIFGAQDAGQTYEQVARHGCNNLIYTKNKEGVEVITPGLQFSLPAESISPVSTIGAGDAFNAGLIYYLSRLPESVALPQTRDQWEEMIRVAIRFSTEVCLSIDNYISVDLGKQLSDDPVSV